MPSLSTEIRPQRRILHLRTVVGKGGGPEKTLLNSHRFLDACYTVRLLYIHPTSDPDFDLPQRAAETGADLIALTESFSSDPRTLGKLLQAIRSFRPDILHAHDYKTDILGVGCGRLLRIPVITTLHGNVTQSRRLNFYYRLDQWALRRMHRVIAVSRDLVEFARSAGVCADKVQLIENAIDLDQYRVVHSRSQSKARLEIDPARFVLGAVGRLMPEKGFDILIRAVAQLRREGWQGLLLIAGEGPERYRLETALAELDCRESVRILGYRTDVPDILQACDAFVLSSRREGFPNVVLEAMALKVPVVATRVAGVPDIISDQESGLLVEPGDATGIVAAVRRLTDHPSLADRLGMRGRQECEQRFNFRNRMQKEQSIYDQILGPSSGTAW